MEIHVTERLVCVTGCIVSVIVLLSLFPTTRPIHVRAIHNLAVIIKTISKYSWLYVFTNKHFIGVCCGAVFMICFLLIISPSMIDDISTCFEKNDRGSVIAAFSIILFVPLTVIAIFGACVTRRQDLENRK